MPSDGSKRGPAGLRQGTNLNHAKVAESEAKVQGNLVRSLSTSGGSEGIEGVSMVALNVQPKAKTGAKLKSRSKRQASKRRKALAAKGTSLVVGPVETSVLSKIKMRKAALASVIGIFLALLAINFVGLQSTPLAYLSSNTSGDRAMMPTMNTGHSCLYSESIADSDNFDPRVFVDFFSSATWWPIAQPDMPVATVDVIPSNHSTDAVASPQTSDFIETTAATPADQAPRKTGLAGWFAKLCNIRSLCPSSTTDACDGAMEDVAVWLAWDPTFKVHGFPAGSEGYERLLAFKVQRSGFTPSISDLTEPAPIATADEQAAARKDGLPGWFANLIDVKVPAIRSHDASARCLDMACSDIMRTGQGSDILDESDEPYAWMDIDDFTTTPVLPAGTFDEPSIFINGFPAGSGAYQRLLAFNVQRDGFTPSIADLTEEAPTATANKQAAATKMGLPGWFANLIDIDVREQGPSTANNSTLDSQSASSPSNASDIVENVYEDTPVLLYAFPLLADHPAATLDEPSFNVDMSVDLSDKLLEGDEFNEDVVTIYYPPGFVLNRQEMYPQTEEEQALPSTPAKGIDAMGSTDDTSITANSSEPAPTCAIDDVGKANEAYGQDSEIEDTPVLLYAFPVLADSPGVILDEASINVDMNIDLSEKLLEGGDFNEDVVLLYSHPIIYYPPGFVLNRQEMYPQTEEEQALPSTPAKGVETRALPSAPCETPVILHGYNNYTSIQQPAEKPADIVLNETSVQDAPFNDSSAAITSVGSSDQSLPSGKAVYEEHSEVVEAPAAEAAVEETEAVTPQTSDKPVADNHTDAEPPMLNNTLAAEFKALFDTAVEQGYLDDGFLSDFYATMSASTASSGPSIDEEHNNSVMKMNDTATGEGSPQADGDTPANAEPIVLDSELMEEAADYGYSAVFKKLLEQALAEGYLDSSFFQEFRP